MTKGTCSVADCDSPRYCRGFCPLHYGRWMDHGSTDDPRPTPEQRFWGKVDKTGDCWVWTGATRGQSGYGMFRPHYWEPTMGAHRYAYQLKHGPLRRDQHLDHLCFTRLCVRPGHLRVVTQAENNQHKSGPGNRNTSGFLGVSWHRASQKWVAGVTHAGRHYYLGLYADAAEAGEAARLKRIELFTHNDVDRQDDVA